MAFLIAVIAAGLLMLVHELVVFAVARRFGIDARIRLGLGTAWWPHPNQRDRRRLQLGVIPFGAFAVVPRGSQRGARALAVAAGLVAAYLGVALIAFALFQYQGVLGTRFEVAQVMPGFPADGKLVAGDTIVAANDVPIVVGHDLLASRIDESSGAPVKLTIRRAGKAQDVTLQPERDEGAKRWLVGVVTTPEIISDPGASASRAVRYPLAQVSKTLGDFGTLPADEVVSVGGPERIVEGMQRGLLPVDATTRALAGTAMFATWMLMALLVLDVVRFVLIARSPR
jgi:membrane-associated protease RseP (regulator of RpoE activity)